MHLTKALGDLKSAQNVLDFLLRRGRDQYKVLPEVVPEKVFPHAGNPRRVNHRALNQHRKPLAKILDIRFTGWLARPAKVEGDFVVTGNAAMRFVVLPDPVSDICPVRQKKLLVANRLDFNRVLDDAVEVPENDFKLFHRFLAGTPPDMAIFLKLSLGVIN